jgi:hypothetical protein
MELATQAVELVGEGALNELEGPALALLSAAYSMRGNEGDLDRALEIGDRALDSWIPGTRQLELAEHYHLHADTNYWAGGYERTLALAQLSAETGRNDPYSAEYRLRGVGMQGLSLAGVGRYEESLVASEDAIAGGRTCWGRCCCMASSSGSNATGRAHGTTRWPRPRGSTG